MKKSRKRDWEASMAKLTKRQQDIFNYIEEYFQREGDAPTIREIADHFEIKSTNAVADHLKALERKGVIERNAGLARGIQLPQPQASGVRIPLLGTIAAGLPILAEENYDDWITVGPEYQDRGDLFALQVSGDSMVDAHIIDGDLVIVRVQERAERGEIVAALIDDEATLKTYYPQGNQVLLLPENKKYDPLVFGPDNGDTFRILGKAIGLVRTGINPGGTE
jgi:repressor LexA